MTMFQLAEFTQATINSVTPRVEKHGDDDKPAVSIKLSIEGPNTLLDAIDPHIRHALYKAKPDETPELPGFEPETPILRCNAFEKHTLTASHEGWTLAIDSEVDDTAPMLFGGCKCDKFVVDAKQGGSIVLTIRVGTSDIDADRLGWLGMHNGEDIWITLTPPKPKADAIDGSTEAFKKDHPDAGDLFAAEHGQGPEEEENSEGGDPDAGQASKDALDASGNNQFGTKPAGSETKPRRGRTAAAEVE